MIFLTKRLFHLIRQGDQVFSDAVEEIKELCPQATVLEGLTIHGNQVQDAKDEIVSWIDSINE